MLESSGRRRLAITLVVCVLVTDAVGAQRSEVERVRALLDWFQPYIAPKPS